MKFYVVVNYYFVGLRLKFHEDLCPNARASVVNARARVYNSYVSIYAWIFIKKDRVITTSLDPPH